jgi:hypothetical protein
MIPIDVIKKIRLSTCSVLYLPTKHEDIFQGTKPEGIIPYIKKEVVATGFLIRNDIVLTNRHVILQINDDYQKKGHHDHWYVGFTYPTGQDGWSETIIRIKNMCAIVPPGERGDLDVGLFSFVRKREMEECKPAEFGELTDIMVGNDIAICGFPLGNEIMVNPKLGIFRFGPVIQQGIISAISPFDTGDSRSNTTFLTDLNSAAGMSGSPVFLPATGRVIGLHYCGKPGTLGIAIPIDQRRVESWISYYNNIWSNNVDKDQFVATAHVAPGGDIVPNEINMNELEKQLFLAIRGDKPGFGLLRLEIVQQWESLQSFLTAQWKNKEKHDYLVRINGCLDKLQSSLLQCSRMRQHHDDLLKKAAEMTPANVRYTAFLGDIACTDFESLLLQGRAALDRLSWFIADSFGQKCQSFRKLRNVVANFEQKSKEAGMINAIIDASNSWFDSSFGKIDSPESLRDLVSHRHALTEGMQTCFGINYVGNRRAIIFDCETRLPGMTKNTPLFRTSYDSIQFLPYIILNCVSILTGQQTYPLSLYSSTWNNRTIVFSDFVMHEPDGTPLGDASLSVAKRMTPDGFDITNRNFDPSISKSVIEF